MSPLDGDAGRMASPTLDERALEALRSGTRSAPAGFDWLVPFVEDLGEATRRPAPVLRPELAQLLAEGVAPVPAPAPAPVPVPAPTARHRRLGARLAAGLGLALAGTTAAGAAGVLPGPAQHVVATVVQAATPFSFPDTADDNAVFGATVSADATGASDGRPGADGTAVNEAAREKTPAPATSGGPPATEPAAAGPETGVPGLDRAAETPAAGHAPTSVPAVTRPSTPGRGSDQAPSSVPAVTRPSTPGQATAGTTPAATRATVTPPGRP